MKSLVRLITIMLATVMGIVAIWQLRLGLWLFILTLGAAAAFRPPIKRLTVRGVPVKIALSVTYIAVLGIIVPFLALIGNPLLVEMQMATNEFTIAYQHISVVWAQDNPARQFIVQQLPSLDNLQQLAGRSEFGMVQMVLGVTSNFFEIIGIIILVLLLSVYWTVDQTNFGRLWLSLIPVEQRATALAIWRDIEANIGNYIRSEMAQAFLTGLSLYVGYIHCWDGTKLPDAFGFGWSIGLVYSGYRAIPGVNPGYCFRGNPGLVGRSGGACFHAGAVFYYGMAG